MDMNAIEVFKFPGFIWFFAGLILKQERSEIQPNLEYLLTFKIPSPALCFSYVSTMTTLQSVFRSVDPSSLK